MMPSTRFHAIASRFSPHNIRTSFRRSSSTSSTSSRASSDRDSFMSQSSSPVSIINSIILRKRSMLMEPEYDDVVEHKELNILEPRPATYFCSLEERMGSF
ncbi:hypothetical protein QBC39DRAFT_374905 [Podospora conica]|nr:hypothetical protein QBC39DRAFT_374905 [Schizothecium conicum]